MATITDVSKVAGVSVATVSRVINKSGAVSKKTEDLVLKTIKKLNYRPNQQARNLRRSESKTILVMLPNITNQYYSNIYDGINRRSQELGYNLFMSGTMGSDPETLLNDMIESKRADGAIMLAIERDDNWIEKYSDHFPIVQCCEYAEGANTVHVSVDNYSAGYEATKFLIDSGHRRVGTISSTNKFMSTTTRMNGYKAAIKEAGLIYNENYVGYSDYEYGYFSSLEASRKLLTQTDRPDALFCIGDSIALSAVVTAHELGISIPNELSVIGFDDVIYTRMLHPYLTSVIQPCSELGAKAMDLLNKLIRGESVDNINNVLPYGFVERESTKHIN